MTGCRYGAKNTLVKNYLGLAEKAGAEVIPMTTVTDFQQRSDGLWEVRTARTGIWATQAAEVHRHSRGAGGGHVRNAEAAVQDARQGQAAEAVRQARGAHPNQLGVDRRRRHAEGVARSGPDPRGGDHLVDPPQLRHSRRTRALRQGLQRDGAAADPDDRRRRPDGHGRPALEAVARQRAQGPARHSADAQPAASGASGPSSRWSCSIWTTRSRRSPSAASSDSAATRASRATASPTRRGSRSATRSLGASPRRSTASPAAPGASCSTSR